MQAFLNAFGGLLVGILQGFDRLVLRGHLPRRASRAGMEGFLCTNRVPFKGFKEHARAQTQRLLQASFAEAKRLGRPIIYLQSPQQSEEELARALAAEHPVPEGLIALFQCAEPCTTFFLGRNRQTRRLEIRPKRGQCSYRYRYALHPAFGFLHARVQTWYPFKAQVCLNGRAWLARQLHQLGMPYRRRDNKFLWAEDFAAAQGLLDQQVQVGWPQALNGILREVHPCHPAILGRLPMDYYWSVYQSEGASDLVFRGAADLQRLYPQWLRHAVSSYSSTDVFRFLGRKLTPDGRIWTRFEGEVSSGLTRRAEGVRLKRRADANPVKLYDCDGVLRIETARNDPSDFKVFRPKQGGPERDKAWRPLRKSAADLYRRAQVSPAANERYAAAAAALQEATPSRAWAEPLCRPAPAPGKGSQRKVRALNPLAAEDAALLTAVLDPKVAVHGLRNRDLVALLYPQPAASAEERR